MQTQTIRNAEAVTITSAIFGNPYDGHLKKCDDSFVQELYTLKTMLKENRVVCRFDHQDGMTAEQLL